MSITRRSFIGSILALGVAPAIVRADSLMRIIPRDILTVTVGEAAWVSSEEFSAMVAAALRKHHHQFVANVIKNNTLLTHLVNERMYE